MSATNEIDVSAEDGGVVVPMTGAAGDHLVWLAPADAREFAAGLLHTAAEVDRAGSPPLQPNWPLRARVPSRWRRRPS
jgi:hypothetical protein